MRASWKIRFISASSLLLNLDGCGGLWASSLASGRLSCFLLFLLDFRRTVGFQLGSCLGRMEQGSGICRLAVSLTGCDSSIVCCRSFVDFGSPLDWSGLGAFFSNTFRGCTRCRSPLGFSLGTIAGRKVGLLLELGCWGGNRLATRFFSAKRGLSPWELAVWPLWFLLFPPLLGVSPLRRSSIWRSLSLAVYE